MALVKTLADLRAALLRRVRVENSTDLTPDVLNDVVNDALYEGRDIITGKWLEYYTVSVPQAVTAGTDTYALPTDFYKLRGVWILTDTLRYRRLMPIDLDALHEYTGTTTADKAYRYLLIARNLQLAPVPASNETLKIWYVPIQAELTNDSDSVTFDVPAELKLILAIGWRDILEGQDLDPSPAVAKVDYYTKLLRTAADGKDAAQPFYLDPHGPFVDDDFDEVW